MSNDEKRKGPAETEVEALRSMLEQRRHGPHQGGSRLDEPPSPDAPEEVPESLTEKSQGEDKAEPPAEGVE